jgi:hypothetical protein
MEGKTLTDALAWTQETLGDAEGGDPRRTRCFVRLCWFVAAMRFAAHACSATPARLPCTYRSLSRGRPGSHHRIISNHSQTLG